MALTIAFDIYGTLIDTGGVTSLLSSWLGKDKATLFSLRWREKQLEYSFRRGLMRDYKNFGECTSQALEYVNQALHADLSAEQKQELMALYGKLPAFSDVGQALVDLKALDVGLVAFSNGAQKAVDGLLEHANLRAIMDSTVSVDELQTFKPNPDVYHFLLKKAGCDASEIWLVSSNPFDVIGAQTAGLRAIWLKRDSHAVFDPWGVKPMLVIHQLTELAALVKTSTLI